MNEIYERILEAYSNLFTYVLILILLYILTKWLSKETITDEKKTIRIKQDVNINEGHGEINRDKDDVKQERPQLSTTLLDDDDEDVSVKERKKFQENMESFLKHNLSSSSHLKAAVQVKDEIVKEDKESKDDASWRKLFQSMQTKYKEKYPNHPEQETNVDDYDDEMKALFKEYFPEKSKTKTQ